MKVEKVDNQSADLYKTLSASSKIENLVEAEEMEEILEALLAPELSTLDTNPQFDVGLNTEVGSDDTHKIWAGSGNDIAVGAGGNDIIGGVPPSR